MPIAAIALLSQTAAIAQSRVVPTAPPAAEILAIKCAGRIRQGCGAASHVVLGWQLPPFELEPEPPATETLGEALGAAYQSAPTLQAQRYLLRAADEDYAQALSELRPTSSVQVTGAYDKTVPGRTTQATRLFDRSAIITSNTANVQATIVQPLSTGGKAAADRDVALAEIRAGRQQLRGVEGDLLLQVVTSYVDVRKDTEELRLYAAFLRQLQATVDEVKARREAGELTRTDIAQAETQLELARSQSNTTRQQLDQDRATYTQYVGHDPGVLAPPPDLPHVPVSVNDAFSIAKDLNPDFARAIEAERESRAKIASARAQGRPTVSISGTATVTGQAYPFYLHNEDQEFRGQAVLTIPITSGGLVRSQVAQAEDRNAADRLSIEATRRQMVEAVITSWNAMATAERNIEADARQVASARIFDDGTFQEYRAGLRSTFDVLYAHTTLVNARIALVAAQHDLYVAEATLLRHIGVLEARALLNGTGLYNPDKNFLRAEHRSALPWDGLVRGFDRIGRAQPIQRALEQPPTGGGTPAISPAATSLPDAQPATVSPVAPLPGTVGNPAPDRSPRKP